MPDAEYLMRTVLPVLYQGMRVVDFVRPADPTSYLAAFVLKHQDQIKLPPKVNPEQEWLKHGWNAQSNDEVQAKFITISYI